MGSRVFSLTCPLGSLEPELKQSILEPIFEEEILPLYGKDIDKVELRMNKVSSHTSKLTAAYLPKKEPEIGIKCIPFDEIRVKSP
ncbi:hypothetical protein TNCV_275321 [Trichonephila clavipes]|nr:hypothetical protein TNCV_275321 [Trichonephila clavipes]